MARYTGPRCRLSRREGADLALKKNWSLERNENPPGQHGLRRTKLSNYGIQLREKQKVKRYYGILERQFRRYYEKAAQSRGITGSVLLQSLENRLDNVVYRLGFSFTRAQARQIVNHGLVLINGKKVDIPSYQVKAGEKISFKATEAIQKFIKSNAEQNEDRAVPGWLKNDVKALTGEVLRASEREDIDFEINEQLIVELYSK